MPYCGDCGRECKAVVADFGIGTYEFQGSVGHDVRKAVVSDCCDARVFEDEELNRPYERDVEQIHYDMLADRADEEWERRRLEDVEK